MDNGAQFVDKILEISGKDHEIKDIHGHKYHVSKSGAKLVEVPSLTSMKLFSLTQAVNFLRSLIGDGGGEVKPGQILVNVVNETTVEIVDSAMNENLNRDEYASLDSNEIFDVFKHGNKYSQEDIIIQLMTKFVPSPEVKELLELVSAVKSDNEANFKDSGFSQTVNVKAGVSLVTTKEIKNLFMLPTYRTFPECKQPHIPYILRLHDGPGGKPLFALYAADGGQWKVDTTKEIREFFTKELSAALGDKAVAVTVL